MILIIIGLLYLAVGLFLLNIVWDKTFIPIASKYANSIQSGFKRICAWISLFFYALFALPVWYTRAYIEKHRR